MFDTIYMIPIRLSVVFIHFEIFVIEALPLILSILSYMRYSIDPSTFRVVPLFWFIYHALITNIAKLFVEIPLLIHEFFCSKYDSISVSKF